MRARGKPLGREDLRKLQLFLNRRRGQSLRDTAVDLAKHWDWRRANGELRERAASNLLLGLARRGLLRLPRGLEHHLRVHRRRRALALRRDSVEPVWKSQAGGDLPGKLGLLVRPITKEEEPLWGQFMDRYHYLGRPRLVGERLSYAAFLSGELVGLSGWAAAALKCAPRDRYLGWSEAERIERLCLVANNVRFLLLGASREKNLASRILGANLRRLSRDWEIAYNHPIYLAETFVDPSRFRGSSYRASNWLLVGETRGWSKRGRSYHWHGAKKLVFVYPLHRRARELLTERLEEEKDSEKVRRVMTEAFDVEALPLAGEGGLFDALGGITDHRSAQGRRHRLTPLLAMAACATLCGARGFTAMAQWASGISLEVRRRLGGRRKPPSEPTFRRVLNRIGVERLEAVVGQWFSRQRDLAGKGLAIDGKSLRGSVDGNQPPAHLVSLQSHEDGLVLAQVRVSEKTNEIKAVKPLLEPVSLEGAIITADAMHAQKETARYIVEEKKADYVLIVKENQPTLLEDIRTLRLGDFSPSGGGDDEGARAAGGAPDLDESSAEPLR